MLYGVKNPHGGDRYGDGIALDFSANVSPLGTPKCVTEAIERGLPELYRYPDPYCRALVQAIARYEGVPGEFILCGNGASELIYAYCEAVRPGRAMELAPTFSEYSLALQRRGCGVVRFALSQEEKFDLQERFLARLVREKIDALAHDACNTTTCFMPYINSFFQPRKESDRPKVVPDGAVNFAFIGQFAETPHHLHHRVFHAYRYGVGLHAA
jgi:hypothetical protein